MHRFVAMSTTVAATLALLPAGTASAGTVTRTSSAATYQANPATAAGEDVALGFQGGETMTVTSSRGVDSSDCPFMGPRAYCRWRPGSS